MAIHVAYILILLAFIAGAGARSYPHSHSPSADVSSGRYPLAPASTTSSGTHSIILTVVTWLGNISSAVLYLAPALSFWRISQKGSAVGYDLTPHLATLLCCLLWGYYEIIESAVMDTTVIIINNSLGAVIQIIYVLIYARYSARHARIHIGRRVFYVFISFTTILVATSRIHGFILRPMVVEMFAALCSVLISGSLLSSLCRAVRQRTVEHIPLALSCAALVSQLLWTTYGLLAPDHVLSYPNALGSFLGLVQLLGYGILRSRYRRGGPLIPIVQIEIGGADDAATGDSETGSDDHSGGEIVETDVV